MEVFYELIKYNAIGQSTQGINSAVPQLTAILRAASTLMHH